MKKQIAILLSSACLFAACGGGSSAPQANSKTASNAANQVNVPAEMSGKPIQPGSEPTPGIPANAVINTNVAPKNGMLAPGIPANAKLQPLPKDAPRPAGIPDDATIKKNLNMNVDANTVNSPNPDQQKNAGDIRQRQIKGVESKKVE